MEKIAAVVEWGETVEAVRLIPSEQVQQQTAEQSVDVPQLREESVEAVSLANECNSETAEQIGDAPQFDEETIEVLKRVLSKRGNSGPSSKLWK